MVWAEEVAVTMRSVTHEAAVVVGDLLFDDLISTKLLQKRSGLGGGKTLPRIRGLPIVRKQRPLELCRHDAMGQRH